MQQLEKGPGGRDDTAVRSNDTRGHWTIERGNVLYTRLKTQCEKPEGQKE